MCDFVWMTVVAGFARMLIPLLGLTFTGMTWHVPPSYIKRENAFQHGCTAVKLEQVVGVLQEGHNGLETFREI